MRSSFRGIWTGLRWFLILVLIAVMMPVMAVIPVHAQPAVPHAFYGSLTINGEPAPVGTEVEARVNGIFAGLVYRFIKVYTLKSMSEIEFPPSMHNRRIINPLYS